MIDLSRVCYGMTRAEIAAMFGVPPEEGGTSRKYRTPSCFRYDRVEFHFQPWKSGGLVFVQEVDKKGSHLRMLLPPLRKS